MSVNAKFQAEFGSFLKGIEEAEVKLADFGKGAETAEGKLNRMIDNFSGRKVIQEAELMATALDKVEGGLKGLTDKELERVGAKAAEAVEKLQRLGIQVPEGIQRIADATKNADAASGSWLESLKSLGAEWVARIATGQILADVIESVVGGVKDLTVGFARFAADAAMQGAAFGDIEENFKHLTSEAGLLSDTLMNTLRNATHNTVSDMALMTTVNKDLAAGMKLSEAEFATMAQGAFALAQATGVDVKTAYDQMNQAMLTGKTRGLGELEGKINLAAAEKKYADSIGKSVDALTETDKLWAARTAILDAVTASTQRLGEQTDGLDEHVAQVSVAWENFRDELGKAIAQSPVLEAGFVGIRNAMVEAFGGNKKEMIVAVREVIERMAFILLDVADAAVTSGRIIVRNFEDARIEFDLTIGSLAAVEASLSKVVKAAAYLGQIVDPSNKELYTGIYIEMEQRIKQLGVEVQNRAADMVAAAAQDQKAAAAAAALHTEIGKIRTAMTEAKNANEAYGPPTREAAAAMDSAALAAQRKAAGMEGDSAATKKATAEQEKFAEAMAQMSAVGEGWKGTLATIDGAVAEGVRYYLEAGVAQNTLATAYGLTAAQVKAVASSLKEEQEGLKAEKAGVEEAARLWSEYFQIVGAGGTSALEKQRADIDAWANDLAAKMKKAGADTEDFYNALGAVSSAKKDALMIDQNAIRENSKQTHDEMAAKAAATYQYMVEHSEDFSTETIEHFRQIAEKAAAAGEAMGTSIKDGADKGTEAIERQDRAVQALVGHFTPLVSSPMESGYFGPEGSVQAAIARTAYAGGMGGMTPQEAAAIAAGQFIGGTVGRRAGGGDVMGGSPYMVGERGPELFVPGASGAILPHGGGMSVTNVFNIVDTESNIARRVSEHLMRSMMGGRRLSA